MTNIQTLENFSDRIIGRDLNNAMVASPGKVTAQKSSAKIAN